MKTPYAILIGLALIAAAIFYREPSIKSARAGLGGAADALVCTSQSPYQHGESCFVLHGNSVTRTEYQSGEWRETKTIKFR